jgi:hypothetical protein
MSDAVDFANDLAEAERATAIAARTAFDPAAGKPGECEVCGRQVSRLIDETCVPCRDYIESQRRH